jgi:MFS family permease
MPEEPAKARGGELPWFVKAMLGAAAWISSLFFVFFVASLIEGTLFDNEGTRVALGVFACLVAGVFFRQKPSSAFVVQTLFVLALFGQALALYAIFSRFGFKASSTPWLVAALFETLILISIPYRPNRFLSALAALVSLYFAAFFWGIAGLFMPLCLALLAVVLYFQWQAPRFWPMVALALSLVPSFVWMPDVGSFDLLEKLPVWLWRAGLAIVWLGVVHSLLKRVASKPLSFENVGVWLLALLLAAGTWPVPMALFALAVFFLGFSQRDKLLEGIGIAQLLWSVGHYYYALEDTLLFKSLTLSALGTALLLLYAVSHHLAGRNRGAEA